MGIAKPTLGYPSRTAAVLALQEQGYSNRQIAAEIGIAVTTVSALACSGSRTAMPKTTVIRVPNHIWRDLESDAAVRHVTVQTLIRKLLATITGDGLVDAILDDAAEVDAKP